MLGERRLRRGRTRRSRDAGSGRQLAACQVKVKLPDEPMLPGVTRVSPLRTRSIEVVLSDASDVPLTVLLLIATGLNFGTASDSGPAASKITSALLSLA